MESFTLLKFWKGTDVGGGANLHSSTTGTPTILPDVSHHSTDTEDDNYDDDDEGPFFDLEFTVGDGDKRAKHKDREYTDDGDEGREDDDIDSDEGTDDEDKREEFAFSLSSSDPNLSLSPSDDLSPRPKKTVSKQRNQSQSKFFTVKFKDKEAPIVSLFTKDNSSRSTNKSQKQPSSDELASDEKKLSKDVMPKYLKMVKARVSKRNSGKMISPLPKSESEVRESPPRSDARREK
ncbi:hypothetical protein Acr_00g0084330 [Actinidia rufa]|uniref:Uncharacterized protein n=1 Tax=Actinidia rufa TaxID=165716 RepID=A0A7J0DVF9_9ERIC|nr:hypothetical protein Acr_00g0084330 [Actinidia rufa]